MRRLLALLMVLVLCAPAMGALADAEKVITVQTGEPECMDPTMNDYSNGSFVMTNLFTGLYTYDANGQIIPGMAESYTVNDDATVFTFTMNPEAKWSDGSKLTAYDFEYAFLRTLNPENAAEGAYALYDIKNAQAYFTGQCDVSEVGVKALDESTLVLETNVPDPVVHGSGRRFHELLPGEEGGRGGLRGPAGVDEEAGNLRVQRPVHARRAQRQEQLQDGEEPLLHRGRPREDRRDQLRVHRHPRGLAGSPLKTAKSTC